MLGHFTVSHEFTDSVGILLIPQLASQHKAQMMDSKVPHILAILPSSTTSVTHTI